MKQHRRKIVSVIAQRQGWKCYLCQRHITMFHRGAHLPDHAATLDHIVPLSRGGDWSEANLAVACYACNQAKGNVLPVVPTKAGRFRERKLAEFLLQMRCMQPLRRIA